MRVVVDTNVVAYYLWQGALARAIASGVAAYDTLFIELAERERLPLATFDKALAKVFPQIARSPAKLLSEQGLPSSRAPR